MIQKKLESREALIEMGKIVPISLIFQATIFYLRTFLGSWPGPFLF